MSGTELIQKWDNCLVFIRDNVSEAVYNAWFTVIKPISMENGELTVQVPSAFVYEYLEQNCLDVFKAALTKVFGRGTRLMYSILTDKDNDISQDISSTNTPANGIKGTRALSNKAPLVSEQPLVQDLNPQLNPKYLLRILSKVQVTSLRVPQVRP